MISKWVRISLHAEFSRKHMFIMVIIRRIVDISKTRAGMNNQVTITYLFLEVFEPVQLLENNSVLPSQRLIPIISLTPGFSVISKADLQFKQTSKQNGRTGISNIIQICFCSDQGSQSMMRCYIHTQRSNGSGIYLVGMNYSIHLSAEYNVHIALQIGPFIFVLDNKAEVCFKTRISCISAIRMVWIY